jgi:tRNA threonylcarbamoyladenosine biosynthesis protein TsaB
MALLLHIETSAINCSVSLSNDYKEIDNKIDKEELSHAANLTVLIESLMKDNRTAIHEIDAVAVSKGPGSYTGLRIGVSVAKGICYALNKPLIGINTLEALASYTKETYPEYDGWFCPMIDARRMEVYYAVYDNNLQPVMDTTNMVLTPKCLNKNITKNNILITGSGSYKASTIFVNNRVVVDKKIKITATNMVKIAHGMYDMKKFEDVVYFEPFYYKDFVAIKPKNRVLNK